jgi:hypothetical protein
MIHIVGIFHDVIQAKIPWLILLAQDDYFQIQSEGTAYEIQLVGYSHNRSTAVNVLGGFAEHGKLLFLIPDLLIKQCLISAAFRDSIMGAVPWVVELARKDGSHTNC